MSSQNRSVRAERGIYRPSPQRSAESRPSRWKIALAAILAMALIGGAGYYFRLRQTMVSGAATLGEPRLQQLVTETLAKHWTWHNLLLLPPSSLAVELKKAEPLLAKVTVFRRWPGGIEVRVEERQPKLRWRSGEALFLLDNEGRAIRPAGDDFKGLIQITDQTNLPVRAGEQVVPTRFITFCLKLNEELPAQQLKIEEMIVPVSISEVHARTNAGYLLKFDTSRPVGEQLAALKLVQQKLQELGVKPQQYIDMRVAGKAYYK